MIRTAEFADDRAAETNPPAFDIVVATAGDPSLAGMLASLADAQGPRPNRVIVVNAHGGRGTPAQATAPDANGVLWVATGCVPGIAGARDLGWRLGTAPWVAVLDERLRVSPDWLERLAEDLVAACQEQAVIRGDVRPAPDAGARGGTAGPRPRVLGDLDVAYRRSALRSLGGFDRRLWDPGVVARDLADRARRSGLSVREGRRRSTLVPVRPDRWAPARRLASRVHDTIVQAGDARSGHRASPAPRAGRPAAVLFERDGTLIAEGRRDAKRQVVPVAGARDALDRLRAAGVAVGLVSHRVAFPRGASGAHSDRMANRRAEELLGPFDVVLSSAEQARSPCACEHPRRGVVARAVALLSADPASIAFVGHVQGDVVAAIARGARGILVPNGSTAGADLVIVPEVEPTVAAAVDLLLEPDGHRERLRHGPLAEALDRQSG